MKRLLALIGSLALLAPSAAWAENLYTEVLKNVQDELTYPAYVVNFAAQVLSTDSMQLDSVLAKSALEGEVKPFCEAAQKQDSYSCQKLMDDLREVADREMDTIRLGHQMEAIASNYEVPVRAFSQQPDKLTSSYATILKIWGIDLGNLKDMRSIRLLGRPDGLDSQVQDVQSRLDALKKEENDEQRTAAVWRYEYGLHFVENDSTERDPDGGSGPGTQRQYLFKRQPDLESALHQLLAALEPTIDPPLEPGETAVFLLQDKPGDAPSNVTIWAYIRRPKGGSLSAANSLEDPLQGLPERDIGLRWATPLLPVAPSLLSDENSSANAGTPILGGKYPPPPEQSSDGAIVQTGGGGLCKSLAGRSGYLCRTRQVPDEETCESDQNPGPQPGVIQLISCRSSSQSSNGGASSSSEDACAKKLLATDVSNGAQTSGTSALPCAPGTDTREEYSILGHTCFVRACGERTAGHSIIPGQDPLVVQESTSPWGACMAGTEDVPPLKIYPSIYSSPSFPAYNPAQRVRELDIQYCQVNGKPPLSPPVICDTSVQRLLQRVPKDGIATSLIIAQETDTGPADEILLGMEAYGAEAGADLYRDYLRQASNAINGTFSTTVDLLDRLTHVTFPKSMCPLTHEDTLLLCPASGSATP